MGACLSGDVDGKVIKTSRNIDKLINQGYVLESEKIKLLLLGAGESGKSTIFKQMRVLFGAPLTEDEKNQITPVVYSNTIASMKLLVQAVLDMGFFEKIASENKESFELIQNTPDSSVIDASVGNAIKQLWNDEGILQAWNRRSEIQIVESVKYYFNEIDRIKEEDYVATQQDLLLARVRTSGIVTEKYVIDGKNFEMYDVGGQRNERKKWIHCFDDVTAVIFVAALSEYDQVLFEDSSTNRMDEAIQLFDEICNTDVFQSSNMILFLNKKDLFQEKILKVHIGDQEVFSDFDTPMGSDDYYDNGIKYFLQKFLVKNKNTDRMIYSHVTCATDSQNVEIVFNSCKDIILRGNLAEEGI
jgi:GTPase SAR1 family protein